MRKSFAGIFIVTVLISGLLVLFADRPIAQWFDAIFHGSALEHALIAAFEGLDWILIVACVAWLVALFALRTPPDDTWPHRLIAGGIASAMAILLAQAIKFLFGRSQVDPGFLRDGIYTAHPFHPGAFPSATMAGVTAFIIGVRLRPTTEKPVVIAVSIVFATALLITSGHWASDIVGGTALGLVTGYRLRRP